MFSLTAKQWLEANHLHRAANSYWIESKNVDHMLPHFGKLLLTDIDADDVSRYQSARKCGGAGPITINLEVGTLRAILRRQRLWANLQPDIRMLRVRDDIGTRTDRGRRVAAPRCLRKSRSRSLFVAVLLSLHTGLRSGQLRLLQRRQIDLLALSATVDKSKTAGGEGRVIPLGETILRCLRLRPSSFPETLPAHYVFPSERYGLSGAQDYMAGAVVPYDINPEKPIG